MAEQNEDPLGLSALAASIPSPSTTDTSTQEGPGDDPLGLTAQLKKKGSTTAVGSTSGSSVLGSNPFLNSLVNKANTLQGSFPYDTQGRDVYAESKEAVKKEIAARKVKQSDTVMKPLEHDPAFDTDFSYAGEIGESLFGRGLARLYATAAKVPEFIYRTASIPQNFIADQTGWESVRPMTPEQIGNTTGVTNKVADYYDNMAKESQKAQSEKYTNSITGYLSQGQWGTASKLAGNQIAESIPVMAGIAAATASGVGEAGVVFGGGAGFGAQHYEEIKDAPVPENVKVFTSLLNGLSEGVFESLGTGKIVEAGMDILKNEGKEVAMDFAKNSFKDIYKSALKKFYVLGAPLSEGLEEAGTQFAQNMIDKYSGVKPDLKLTDGVVDSFIVGAGSGVAMSAPVSAYAKITNSSNKLSIRAQIEGNQRLADDMNNPDVDAGVKGTLLKQFMENNDRINNQIEINQSRLDKLTPEQHAESENLLIQINQLDDLIGNDKVSPEAKASAVKQQDALYTSLNTLLGNEPEVVDTKTQIERQNSVDQKIAEFQTRFPDRTVDPLDDLPASVVRTFDRVDNNIPTDVVAINEASDWLYSKYKALTAMKQSDTRMLTTDQINSYQEQLQADITQLENHKQQYHGENTTGTESSSVQSEVTGTAVQSKAAPTSVSNETASASGATEGRPSASSESITEADKVASASHLKVSSDAKTALREGRKKQSIDTGADGNPITVEHSFDREDADLELDRLHQLAKKGKLTPEEFQKSYFGQVTDTPTFHSAVADIEADPIGFVTRLRESFESDNSSAKTESDTESSQSQETPRSATTTEAPISEQSSVESGTPKESQPVKEESTKEPKVLRTVEHVNKDLGKIKIDELSNDRYVATYEDGNKETYSKEDIKDVTGFDPDINTENEGTAKLSAATDPNEVAAMYDAKVKELSDTGSKNGAIAQYRPSATQEEFAHYNDGNNMSDEIRLQYTPVGKKGRSETHIPLDTQAQEINNMYFNGHEVVTPNDLTDFMQSYPKGPESYSTTSGNSELRSINEKYKELTGGKSLRRDTAERLAEKYHRSVKDVNEAKKETIATEDKIREVFSRELMMTEDFDQANALGEKLASELDKYAADPTNEFNLFYEAFGGQEISKEEIDEYKNIVNGEQQEDDFDIFGDQSETGSSSESGNEQDSGSETSQKSESREEPGGKQTGSVEKRKADIDKIFDNLKNKISDVGTKEQYSEYLDGIFPESENKTIFYHNTTNKDIVENGFDSEYKGERHGLSRTETESKPVYLTASEDFFNHRGHQIPVLVDVRNTAKIGTDIASFDDAKLKTYKERGFDSASARGTKNETSSGPVTEMVFGPDALDVYYPVGDPDRNHYDNVYNNEEVLQDDLEFVVFNTNQTHVLGSKQDIDGFKQFVDSKSTGTAKESAEQRVAEHQDTVNNIQKELNTLQKGLSKNLSENQAGMFGENKTQSMFDDRADQQKLVTKKEAELKAAQKELLKAKQELSDAKESERQHALSLPDRIRSMKVGKGKTFDALLGIPVAIYDGALETLATAIEAGQSVAKAMQRAIDHIMTNSTITDEEAVHAALREDLALQGIDTDMAYQPTKDPQETIPEFALRLSQFRRANMPNLDLDGNINGSKNAPQVNAFNGQWTLPEESMKDKMVRMNVDFLNRLEVAENAIRAAGGTISAEESAYVQSQLLSAKAGKKIDDVLDDVVVSPNKRKKSLFQRVKEAGHTIEELGLFAYAQHAPERNSYVSELRQNNFDGEFARLQQKRAEAVAEKRPTKYIDSRISLLTKGNLPGFELLPDGGSGMTNSESADILNQFKADGKYDSLDKFANEYRDKVTRPDLEMQFKNGLISDVEYNDITKRYKNYVPLQVEQYVQKGWAANIKNLLRVRKTVNRTVGSAIHTFNERVNPVLYGLVKIEKSTIESTKNELLSTLKELVIQNPNDDVWQVVKPQFAPEYNADGSVKRMKEITSPEVIKQSVEAFDNGKRYYIHLKDDILRRAITKEGVKKGVPVLNAINSFYRGVYTTYNPNFILENSIKDPQEALFMISGEAKGIKRKFLTSIPGALKGIYNHQKGDRTSAGAQLFEEYLNSGAKITFNETKSDIEKIDNVRKALSKMDKKGVTPLTAMSAVKDWFDSTSNILELTTRVAAYKAAKESGMSQSEAASLSRNATVDFAKKGELTAWTNAAYLFANAGTQGGFNMLKRVLTSKHGRKVMGAYVMAGFASAMFNSLLGDDDDKNDYWKIPDYQRQSSLILKVPGVDGFFKMPIGRTLAVPFYAGSMLYGTLTGKAKPVDAMKGVLMSTLNTYNPIGGGSELMQVMAPTVADPFVQALTNKNAFGGPITKDTKFGTPRPNSQSYFKNTNPIAIATTNWLNHATGGSAAESGGLDISPNRLEWVAQQAGGGTANFVKNNILRFSTGIAAGDWDGVMKDAPLLGRFYTNSKSTNNLGPVFSILQKSGTHQMDASDKTDFIQALKTARKAKEMNLEDMGRYMTIFKNNQVRIRVAAKHPEWGPDQVDHYMKNR